MECINKGDLMAKWQTLTYDQKLSYQYGWISDQELDEDFEESVDDGGFDLDEAFSDLERFKNANFINR